MNVPGFWNILYSYKWKGGLVWLNSPTVKHLHNQLIWMAHNLFKKANLWRVKQHLWRERGRCCFGSERFFRLVVKGRYWYKEVRGRAGAKSGKRSGSRQGVLKSKDKLLKVSRKKISSHDDWSKLEYSNKEPRDWEQRMGHDSKLIRKIKVDYKCFYN